MPKMKTGNVEKGGGPALKKWLWLGLLAAIAVCGVVAGLVWFHSRVDLQPLKGKWQRADGGYVLDIRSVGADGKLDAAYFNPSPIHVAKAEARAENGEAKVFVELRDVNYPGSTYNLTHNEAGDCLQGVYYQATQKQTYEVVFERMKP